jgi:carbon storage regulator CsrA
MLVLTRKWGEAIQIGNDIRVTVVKIDKRLVRLGIEAPTDVRITRPEARRHSADEVLPERAGQPRSILVVDDSPEDREAYRRLINTGDEPDYQLTELESGEEALQWCESHTPDCVLLDYVLPDLTGLEFLERLSHLPARPRFPVVMLSGQGDEWVAVRAIKSGAHDYLPKRSISSSRLRTVMQEAMASRGSPPLHS